MRRIFFANDGVAETEVPTSNTILLFIIIATGVDGVLLTWAVVALVINTPCSAM